VLSNGSQIAEVRSALAESKTWSLDRVTG
jgi:hypothetical protein